MGFFIAELLLLATVGCVIAVACCVYAEVFVERHFPWTAFKLCILFVSAAYLLNLLCWAFGLPSL